MLVQMFFGTRYLFLIKIDSCTISNMGKNNINLIEGRNMHNPNNIYSNPHYNGHIQPSSYPVAVKNNPNRGYPQMEQNPSINNPRYYGAFPEFFSLKCYGTKAAIELKPSLTKTSKWETIMLEAAISTGPKQFNWPEKTAIQITKSELPHVISTFLGIKKKFEGKSHGALKNKSFSMEWQSKNDAMLLFVCITEGGKPAMAVPISGFDAMMLGHMACVQYIRNFPSMTADACIESLKIMARHNI
jgi:hypothetical protein